MDPLRAYLAMSYTIWVVLLTPIILHSFSTQDFKIRSLKFFTIGVSPEELA
uniref:Uncharacterized protein n=1 Tax=Rhizophora mucronata TaxID=61149 RepID=A0A2P2LBD1_RHIMU